jgi:hypothetical protein
MRLVQIEAYKYEELSDKAKQDVAYKFDMDPFDYEDDEGNIRYDYFSDWTEEERIEFCDVNEYEFNKTGKIINHLIVESA